MKNNKWSKIIIFTTMILLTVGVCWTIDDVDLKSALITLAQLNVAIAVGIGALSISISTKDESKKSLAEIVIAISALSILTFLIAYLEINWLCRIYILLNVIIIIALLIFTLIIGEKE